MHCIQYVAVRAEDKDSALAKARDYLETAMGPEDTYASWYDWFVAGGGRWSSDPDSYRDTSVDVAALGEPKFDEYVEQAKSYKENEYKEIIEYAKKQVVDLNAMLDEIQTKAVGLEPLFEFSMRLYPLSQLYKMTGGDWGHFSYFYDVEHQATHTEYMVKSYQSGDSDWFIVPVDFHF